MINRRGIKIITKINVIFIIIILILIILSGCSNIKTDNPDDGIILNLDKSKFIGTWEQESSFCTYVFYENDTFLSECIDNNEYTHMGTGDYTVENGMICMKTHPEGAITDNDSYCYTYEFSENNTHVQLTNDTLPTAILVKKID